MDLDFHPLANLIPEMQTQEFEALRQDIAEKGLQMPIVLLDGQILDGRHRYRAVMELRESGSAVEPRFVPYEGNDPAGFVYSVNVPRRHLDVTQRACIGLKLKEYFQGETKQGARTDLQEAKSTSDNPTGSSAKPASRESRTRAAGMVNVSASVIDKVARVERESPALFEAMESGAVTVWEAERELNRADRIERIVAVSEAAPLESLGARYPVIYCDPPWRYEHVKTESRAIENQYPTMTLDDICGMNIEAISTPDCIIFMWTTSPKLLESFRVLEAWGFTYRTCAVWDKEKIGMGYYFRQQHEILLVATKGSIPTPVPENRPSSVIRIARAEHSAKPFEVAAIIEKMYPELPKIELFCRTPRDGWAAWGNQVGGTDENTDTCAA